MSKPILKLKASRTQQITELRDWLLQSVDQINGESREAVVLRDTLLDARTLLQKVIDLAGLSA